MRELIKEKIEEKLDHKLEEDIYPYKRQTVLKGTMNKAINNLYKGYRQLDKAIEMCDDQEVRKKLEDIKLALGKDAEMGYDFTTDTPSIINKLSDIISTDIDV